MIMSHAISRKRSPFLVALMVLWGAGLSTGSARAQEAVPALIARIEGPQIPNRQGYDAMSLGALMQRLHVPGVSLAVVKDFRIHWAKAYGVADAKTGRLLDTDSRFQAASISKPVTAFAAMRLVQERRLDLDADINTILKSWHLPASELTRDRPVSPRSLFSHTSGADDGFGFPGYDPAGPLPSLLQVLNGQAPSNVGTVTFTRPPFQGYKYSGGGLVIVQQALVDLTGRPFAEFMQSTVLGPLSMAGSSFDQPPAPETVSHAARAHDESSPRRSWRVRQR
jgi:CubicO group peptidase (beta-lactamase class C family)